MEPGQVSLVDQINAKKALAFGRMIAYLAIAKNDPLAAFQVASARRDIRVAGALEAMMASRNDTLGELIERGAVSPGSTTDATWAGPLAPLVPIAAEFVEYLRPQTVIGRLNVRPVPFNCTFARATSGTAAAFVGQGQPIPVGKIDFDSLSLGFARIAIIVAITLDLAKFGSPDAVGLISADAAAAIVLGMDQALLDPNRAAVPGVSPASITNGAPTIASTGSTADKLLADAKAAMLALDPNIPLAECTWIMSQKLAVHLATLPTTTSEPAFEDFAFSNGTWIGGLPTLVSAAAKDGNSANQFLALVHGPSIAVADGLAEVSVTQNAALVLDDAPSGSAAPRTSLWQQNLVGVRVQRFINWEVRRVNSVAVVRDIVV